MASLIIWSPEGPLSIQHLGSAGHYLASQAKWQDPLRWWWHVLQQYNGVLLWQNYQQSGWHVTYPCSLCSLRGFCLTQAPQVDLYCLINVLPWPKPTSLGCSLLAGPLQASCLCE